MVTGDVQGGASDQCSLFLHGRAQGLQKTYEPEASLDLGAANHVPFNKTDKLILSRSSTRVVVLSAFDVKFWEGVFMSSWVLQILGGRFVFVWI